jgi:hypothetical protein
MGFRQANIYIKGLADALGIDENVLSDALAKNRTGGYARIWEIEDKESYAECRLSTSRKAADGKNWIPDFQDGFIRFVGNAYEKVMGLSIPTDSKGKTLGLPIQITSCEATTYFSSKTEKTYHNYAIFAFELVEENAKSNKSASESKSTKKTAKAEKTTKTKKQMTPETEPDEESGEDDLPF